MRNYLLLCRMWFFISMETASNFPSVIRENTIFVATCNNLTLGWSEHCMTWHDSVSWLEERVLWQQLFEHNNRYIHDALMSYLYQYCVIWLLIVFQLFFTKFWHFLKWDFMKPFIVLDIYSENSNKVADGFSP